MSIKVSNYPAVDFDSRTISTRTPNYYVLFVVGMLLLNFSSSPSSGGVISYGTPFLLLAALLFIPVFFNNLRNFGLQFLLLPTLFVAFMFMTSFLAVSPMASIVRAAANFVGYLMFLGLIAASMRHRVSVDSIARVLLMSGAFLALYFLLNMLWQSLALGFRAVILERYVGGAMSLPWGASNTIAQVLLLSVGSYLAIDNKRKKDVVCLLLIISAILFTFSRSVSLLLICMLYIILGFKRFAFLIGLGVVATFFYTIFQSGGSMEYDTFLTSRLSVENMQSGNGRLDTAYEKLNYFIMHPFEPIGYYSSIYNFSLSAHNYWITTLVEQSVFSVMISLLFFGSVGRMALAGSRKVFYGFLVVMCGLMVEDPNFVQPYIISFWVYFAILVSRGLEQKEFKSVRYE